MFAVNLLCDIMFAVKCCGQRQGRPSTTAQPILRTHGSLRLYVSYLNQLLLELADPCNSQPELSVMQPRPDNTQAMFGIKRH